MYFLALKIENKNLPNDAQYGDFSFSSTSPKKKSTGVSASGDSKYITSIVHSLYVSAKNIQTSGAEALHNHHYQQDGS